MIFNPGNFCSTRWVIAWSQNLTPEKAQAQGVRLASKGGRGVHPPAELDDAALERSPFAPASAERPRMLDSGARAGRAGIRRAVGVDVEWSRGALDDLLRDHHFLDPLEARQIEHCVEQDALHDR